MQNGWTSLIYAAEKNRLPSIVQEFFNHGANPDAKDANGNTALRVACSKNNLEIVKDLLSNNGGDPCLPGPDLPVRVSLRHPACLELLISAGADLHAYAGLVELATSHSCLESVKLLLDGGVDPNER